MFNLMKYEFRKQITTKIVFLLALIATQLYYFISIRNSGSEESFFMYFTLFTIFSSIVIFMMAIEGIVGFSNDLKRKNSYMLFMVPHSTFKIVAAKYIVNIISVIIVTIIISMTIRFNLYDMVRVMFGVEIDNMALFIEGVIYGGLGTRVSAGDIVFTIVTYLASFLGLTSMGILAIVISRTILAEKKFKGILSFIIFGVLTWLQGKIIGWLPDSTVREVFTMSLIVTIIFIIISYILSCILLKKKISL